MKKLYYLLSIVAIFALLSCGAQKRHDSLIRKYGKLCVVDTVTVTDTIIKTRVIRVPEYKDSFIFKHDTMYETKEVYIYRKGDVIYLKTKPKEITVRDTIPIEVKVPAQVIPCDEEKESWWWKIIISAFIGFVIALVLRKAYRV
jgi:hypothetical protein